MDSDQIVGIIISGTAAVIGFIVYFILSRKEKKEKDTRTIYSAVGNWLQGKG